MRDYYQQIGPDYARHRRIHPGVFQGLIATAALREESSVLEIGCGTGNYLRAIVESIGCDGWGLDPAEGMLAEARQRSTTEHFVCASAEDTTLPAARFDLAFAVDVIHHIANRPQAFHEIRRVLKPGGRLCLATDSPEIIRRRVPHATFFPETVEVELARYPAIETLRAELTAASFTNLSEVAVESPFEITDAGPYRAKTHSSIKLIPQEAFERGLARLEEALRAGPVPGVSRYVLLWATA